MPSKDKSLARRAFIAASSGLTVSLVANLAAIGQSVKHPDIEFKESQVVIKQLFLNIEEGPVLFDNPHHRNAGEVREILDKCMSLKAALNIRCMAIAQELKKPRSSTN